MNNYTQPSPQQIAAWVNKHFPDNKPRKDGSELRINSPFCADDGHHFNISTERAVCHDWRGDDTWAGPKNPRTGKRGCSFIKFVQLFLKCSYWEAVKEIGGVGSSPYLKKSSSAKAEKGPSFNQKEEKDPDEPNLPLPDGSVLLAKSKTKKVGDIIYGWLASRGVSSIMADQYKIHHIGTEVIWPYYEFDKLVYWQARSLTTKNFKFPSLSQYGVNKSDYLYNFDHVEPASHVTITESIFGAMTIGHQCVATGGADLSDTQVRKIMLLGPRDGVVLSPDNDHAGINSIIRNAKKLAFKRIGTTDLKVYYSLPPEVEYITDGETKLTKDWNELFEKCRWPLERIRETFENSVAPFDIHANVKLATRLQRLKPSRPSV